jgi:hypothetical protein
MRINEILTESQLQQLEEGPMLNAFGRGIGKFAGGVAKGIGAVAGGVVGAGKALKKGYQTGKAIVGDDPDPNAGAPGYTAPADPKVAPAPVADPKVAPAPVADPKVAPAPAPTPSTTTPPSADEINAQGPEGSAPAKTQTGDAGKALAKSTAVVDKTQAQSQEKANQTVYAQVKANIDKLDKKGKQRILQLLQKSVAAPAPKPAAPKAPAGGAPTAADPAAPTAADPAAPTAAAAADPGAAAFGNMAKTLSQEPTKAATPAADPAATPAADPAATPAADPAATPAADPAAAGGKLTPAQQAAKVAELKGKRAAGKTTGTTGSGFGGYVKKASGERVVGANKDGSVRTVNIKASKINYGNALSEELALRVEAHKQKMFETGLAQGTTSIFRK